MMIDLVMETEAELCIPLRVLSLRNFETRGQNAAIMIGEVVRIKRVKELGERCSDTVP